MREYKGMKACSHFLNLEDGGFVPDFVMGKQCNCKDCAFFSSRNCQKEVTDGVSPDMIHMF